MCDFNNFPLYSSQYQILHKIGHGVMSDVYAARCIPNGQLCAIKIINLDTVELNISQFRRGISFWATSKHPNLVQYYCSFVVDSSLWIVMEYMDGGSSSDIMEYGFAHGFKDETLIATIVKNVLEFLEYFHSNHLIHRKIQPSNILFSEKGEIKVGNLSLSAGLIQEGIRKVGRTSSLSQTCYLAPEVLQGKPYTEVSDIWSLGVTISEFAKGIKSLGFKSEMEQIKSIETGSFKRLVLMLIDDSFSDQLREFIDLCLTNSPDKRPTAKALLSHKFLKKARDSRYITTTLMNQVLPLDRRFEILHGKDIHPQEKQKCNHKNIDFNFNPDDDFEKKSNAPQQNEYSTVKLGRFTVVRKVMLDKNA